MKLFIKEEVTIQEKDLVFYGKQLSTIYFIILCITTFPLTAFFIKVSYLFLQFLIGSLDPITNDYYSKLVMKDFFFFILLYIFSFGLVLEQIYFFYVCTHLNILYMRFNDLLNYVQFTMISYPYFKRLKNDKFYKIPYSVLKGIEFSEYNRYNIIGIKLNFINSQKIEIMNFEGGKSKKIHKKLRKLNFNLELTATQLNQYEGFNFPKVNPFELVFTLKDYQIDSKYLVTLMERKYKIFLLLRALFT